MDGLTLAELITGAMLITGAAALTLWPRHGLVASWRRRRERHARALAEDALKHLHAEAWQGHTATLGSVAGALRLSPRAALQLIRRMESRRWVSSRAGAVQLTPDGERLAVEVVRAHRLWERYLADEARMPLGDIHAEAEQREHDRPAGSVEAMAAALGYPTLDPHGDPIPSRAGRLERPPATPVTDWPPGAPARIVHLEDEPEAAYRQLVAERLSLGQVVQVIEAGPERIVLSDGEHLHTLAPIVAANVFVAPSAAPGRARARATLAALPPGRQAVVAGLDEALQGFTRRRLLDLGLTPGVPITAELRSLFGDPIAYRVRGALVALRRDQAAHVYIDLPAQEAAQP